MNIQTEKLKIIEWILGIQDKEMLGKLANLKKEISNIDDWSNDLNQEELASIERGLQNIIDGKVHSHADVMKEYEKYL